MSVLRALVALHVRQVLRSGTASGRPSYGFRAGGRRGIVVAAAALFAWQLLQFGSTWVSAHRGVAKPIVSQLFQPVLVSVGSFAAIVITFYAFNRLIGSLLDGRDLRLLLLAPVHPELVLGERILMTSLSFSAVLLIAAPALLAVGNGVGMGPGYDIAVLAAILILPLGPTSVAALVLLLFLGRLPPSRARGISSFLGVGVSLAIFVISRLVSSSRVGSLPSLPAWLPTTWTARAVADIGMGHFATALLYGALAVGVATALFAGATVASARVLASGVGSYAEVRRRTRELTHGGFTHSPTVIAVGSSVALARGGHWWPIFTKDLLSMRRDPQRLALLLYPMVIVGFNAVQILSRQSSRYMTNAEIPTIVLLMFTCLVLANTTAPGLINLEGRSLVLLALAPVSENAIVLSKWIAALIPVLVVVETALVGMGLYLHLRAAVLAVLAIFLATLATALVGTTLVINICWPKLDATRVRRSGSVPAAILGLIADAVICISTGALLFAGLDAWHGLQAQEALGGLFIALWLLIVTAAAAASALLARFMHSGPLVGDV